MKSMLHGVCDWPEAAQVNAHVDQIPGLRRREAPRWRRARRRRPGRSPGVQRLRQVRVGPDLVENHNERLKCEIRGRTDSIRVFLTHDVIVRLVGAVLAD